MMWIPSDVANYTFVPDGTFPFHFFPSMGWFCGVGVFRLTGCSSLPPRLALPTSENNNNNAYPCLYTVHACHACCTGESCLHVYTSSHDVANLITQFTAHATWHVSHHAVYITCHESHQTVYITFHMSCISSLSIHYTPHISSPNVHHMPRISSPSVHHMPHVTHLITQCNHMPQPRGMQWLSSCGTCHMASSFFPLSRTTTTAICSLSNLLVATFTQHLASYLSSSPFSRPPCLYQVHSLSLLS